MALISIAAAWVPTVRAQEAAPAVSEGARAAGEALLESGRAAYRFGNYVQAMRDFEQALARLGRPSIHYDIGDAAARLGDHQKAIDEFRQYLSALPNASNRASVERRIQLQEQALQKAKGEPDLTPSAAAATQADNAAPQPQAAAAHDTSAGTDPSELWWLWAGIGAAVVGTVVAALIVSSSDDPVQPPLHGDVGGTIQTLRVR
ncbi:MAG TPA: tetratricopeptide repeat protein [Polyangiales bacterium]|nr:tetratricopeptide repeat protein [Polyangiales bacterium]